MTDHIPPGPPQDGAGAPPPGWLPPPAWAPPPAGGAYGSQQAPGPAPQYGPQSSPQYGPQYGPQSSPQYGPQFGPPGAAPQVWTPEEPAPPNRARRGLALLSGGVAALLAAALTFFLVRGSDGASGGASSPEAALSEAVAAATKQDAAKVLAMINPGETRTLGALLDVTRKKVAASGVVSASGPLEPWLALSVTGLRLSTRSVRPDLAFVSVLGGSADAAVDQGAMPGNIRPDHPRTVHRSSDLARIGDGVDPQHRPVVAAVRTGGRWYLSPTTTALENVRRAQDLPEPDWTHATPLGEGARSPEAVLPAVVSALQRRDLRAVAGLLSPGDVPAAGYYYSSFAALLSRQLDHLQGLEISNLDTSVQDMSDGLKKVVVHGADFRAAVSGGELRGGYRSGCVTTSDSDRPDCIPSALPRLTGWKDLFVVVDHTGGSWHLSPIATLLEYLRVDLADGSTNALYRFFGIERLAPVTQTVHTGGTVTVQLNDAGFANVDVKGTAGQCIAAQYDGGTYFFPSSGGGGYDGSCEGYAVPSGGTLRITVLGKATGEAKDVQLDLRPR